MLKQFKTLSAFAPKTSPARLPRASFLYPSGRIFSKCSTNIWGCMYSPAVTTRLSSSKAYTEHYLSKVITEYDHTGFPIHRYVIWIIPTQLLLNMTGSVYSVNITNLNRYSDSPTPTTYYFVISERNPYMKKRLVEWWLRTFTTARMRWFACSVIWNTATDGLLTRDKLRPNTVLDEAGLYEVHTADFQDNTYNSLNENWTSMFNFEDVETRLFSTRFTEIGINVAES